MSMRGWQLAASLLSLLIVPLSTLNSFDLFPRLPSLSTDANPRLRSFIPLYFASPSSEVVHIRPAQHSCNSERLRAVLEQSVSDSKQRSMWAILARLHDSQFSVNCMVDGTPVLPRRALFCQLTVGRTTCAITTGTPHPSNSSIMVLRRSKIFRPPRVEKRPSRPVKEVDELSEILATMGPEPPRKRRSDGHI